MKEDVLEKYLLAGKIASEVKKEAKRITKEGEKVFDIVETLENLILERGGKLAFPINFSIDEIAAHYTPLKSDQLLVKSENIIKVDIGVHVEGYIADTAITINPDRSHEKLIQAAEDALTAATKIAKIGTKIGDIGATIQAKIESHGFNPVKNLGGHFMARYVTHTGDFIPNVRADNDNTLKEGDVIAIEPFATMGSGLIKEGKPGNIYKLSGTSARGKLEREVLKRIFKESKTLPFTPRWLRDISEARANLAISQLLKQGSIQKYPILRDVDDKLISQAEHTVIILEKPIITTI